LASDLLLIFQSGIHEGIRQVPRGLFGEFFLFLSDAFLPYFGNSQLVRHALMHAYSRISPDPNHAKAVERWRDGVARFLGD
jgi:hypothetical protein